MKSARPRTHPLSNLELRQEIGRLNRLDPARADYDGLLRTYNTLFIGMRVVIKKAPNNETLFRVRIINGGPKPATSADVSVPPPSMVNGYQRCNGPGQSTFYASSRRLTALYEARVKPGDLVYLSQWVGKDNFPTNMYFYWDKAFVHLLSNQAHSLMSYFDTLFTRRVESAFSDDYKFTAAISDLMTRGLPSGLPVDIRADRSVALRYPSVMKYDGSYNTAMSDEMARTRLELLHVMEIRVLEVSGDDSIRAAVLDNGFGRKNGSIEWSGNPSSVPSPRQPKGILFIHQGGGEWNISVRNETLTPKDIDELLRE